MNGKHLELIEASSRCKTRDQTFKLFAAMRNSIVPDCCGNVRADRGAGEREVWILTTQVCSWGIHDINCFTSASSTLMKCELGGIPCVYRRCDIALDVFPHSSCSNYAPILLIFFPVHHYSVSAVSCQGTLRLTLLVPVTFPLSRWCLTRILPDPTSEHY